MTLDPVLAVDSYDDNAGLITAAYRLGHLRNEWSTLDTTYGEGTFWKAYRPPTMVMSDLAPSSPYVRPDDFRALPWPSEAFDVVVFDPPYGLRGTINSSNGGYGLGEYKAIDARHEMMMGGLGECCRVARHRVLAKCQDQVCVDDETEILTQRGWLGCDDVVEGDMAYTLNHETGMGEWQEVLDVWRLSARSREMLSMEQRGHSSLTTLDHQWAVLRGGRRHWTMSRTLGPADAIPIAAPCADQPTEPKFSDAFVELVAWFWTEGNVPRLDGRRGGAVRAPTTSAIYQSRTVNPANCARIEYCLATCFGPPVDVFPQGPFALRAPSWARRTKTATMDEFVLSANLTRALLEVAPGKVPSVAFLADLTTSQLTLFIETAVRGDGHAAEGRNPVFIQKARTGAERFQLACVLAGKATNIRRRPDGLWVVLVRLSQSSTPSRRNAQRVEHHGRVWCVTTRNSTWLARRHGTMYFTGNCSGQLWWQTRMLVDTAEAAGWALIERLDMLGGDRPQPERERWVCLACGKGSGPDDDSAGPKHHCRKVAAWLESRPEAEGWSPWLEKRPSPQRHAYGRPSSLLIFGRPGG